MVTVWFVLMLASAVVALTLATGLTVAAWGGRRDGLRTWALALALQALACSLLGWRAQWPVIIVVRVYFASVRLMLTTHLRTTSSR